MSFRAALLCSVVAFSAAQRLAWPQTPTRTVRVLDGSWQFAWLGSNVTDVSAVDPTTVTCNARMVVPGAWDLSQIVVPGSGLTNLAGAHGTAVYRLRTYVTPGAYMRLHFGACGLWCAVWVDGVKVAEHGGNEYSAFWVGGIAPSQSPWREVAVVADNRFNYTRVPLHAYVDDWYQYGGLFRSVELHELPPVSLQQAHVLVQNAAAGTVDVRVTLHDLTETVWWIPADVMTAGKTGYAPRYRGFGPGTLPRLPAAVNLTLTFDADATADTADAAASTAASASISVSAPVDADGVVVISGLTVPNATLWSAASPALHTVTVTLPGAAAADVLVERFGLRAVSVCKTPGANGSSVPAVCVNGVATKLLGYGRHDTGPHAGHAISDFQRLRDIQLVAGLGGNYMRLGHYAQHPNMASLCDEAGMMNGVEVIGWDSSTSTYSDPLWIGAGIVALEEQTNSSFNHPSTLTYAFINEGASNTPSACPAYALLNARYKQLGVQGLTTYANDQGTADVCFGPSGADVLGFNTYPGWYNPAPAGSDPSIGWEWQPQLDFVVSTLDGLASWMSSQHPDAPFYISELGAGAIPGWMDEMSGYWGGTYQARILSAGATNVAADPRWSGIALWQLMDQRVYQGSGALGRPRSFNNKGTFDEHRKPKPLAWMAVYNAFHGLPPPQALADPLLPG